MIYKASSRTARAVTQRNLVSKNKQTKNTHKGYLPEAFLGKGVPIPLIAVEREACEFILETRVWDHRSEGYSLRRQDSKL